MKLFAMLLICLPVSFAFAQAWRWQNTLIQGNDLPCITFVPGGQYGWATSSYGDVIVTGDYGATWSLQSTWPGHDWARVALTDPTHACAIDMYGGVIWHTSNSGQTWTVQFEDTLFELRDITFADAFNGWAVGANGSGYGLILNTTDAGLNWVLQDSTSPDGFESISFVNSLTGWAIGHQVVAHTLNGGDSWSFAQPNRIVVDKVKFFENGRGWALGLDTYWHGSQLLGTTDGGLNWVAQTCGDNPMDRILGFDFCDESNGWAVGFSGGIYHTTNAGATWSSQVSGTTGVLISARAASQSEAWAVGGGGLMLHTVDGGVHWTAQAGNPVTAGCDLEKVEFCDTLHGWAVGSDGTVLRTINGGQQWLPVGTGHSYEIRSLAVFSPETVWLAGNSDTILSTMDGGVSWTPHVLSHSSNYNTPLLQIAHAGTDHVWVLSDSVYRTTDGGQTWSGHDYLPSLGYNYFARQIVFADENHGWIVSLGNENGGTIVHTTDGGETWNEQYTSDWSCAALTCLNADTAWATASRDSLLYTTNGGVNWNPIWVEEIVGVQDLEFADGLNGWMINPHYYTQNLFHTTDGGVSWQEAPTPCGNGLADACFVDASHGWVAGSNGVILKYDPNLSPVTPRRAAAARSIALSAYPNPFNPNTILSFDVSVQGRIQLAVYDVTGRLVETLADRVFPAGNATFSYNASHLASGVYFVRLSALSGTVTHKILLLK